MFLQVREVLVSMLPPEHDMARHYSVLVSWRGGDRYAVTDMFGFDLVEHLDNPGARYSYDQAIELAGRIAPTLTCNGRPVSFYTEETNG